MGEKRDGFGLPSTQEQSGDSFKAVFQTPHYRVIVVRLSNGADDQPQELRIRYVVMSKEDPVIAAHSGLKGEAIALALAAEQSLQRAAQLAQEEAARNYKPRDNGPDGGPFSFGGGTGAPNLG